MGSPKFQGLLADKSAEIGSSGDEVRGDAGEVGGCFCGGVHFLISLNASVAGNPEKGDVLTLMVGKV